MAAAIDLSGLTRDECCVILAMLYFRTNVICDGETLIAGANVWDLDLPATWHKNNYRKIYNVCELLVRRGVFLRQHGDNYRDTNYRGRAHSDVWYAFNETLFLWGGEQRTPALLLTLAGALLPVVARNDTRKLLVLALQDVGQLIESLSSKQNRRELRKLKTASSQPRRHKHTPPPSDLDEGRVTL